MKDILDREIPDGSLVIGMIVSRDSDGMRFGIFKDNKCIWKRWGLMKSKPRNVYLVENPSEKELEIKQEIFDELHKKKLAEKQEEEHKKSLKRIPKNDLIVGGYYLDDKGGQWCYLGFSTVSITITDGYNRVVEEPEIKHGYCYVQIWRQSKTMVSNVVVLKHSKRFVGTFEPEAERRVDMGNLKESKKDDWYSGNVTTTEISLGETK